MLNLYRNLPRVEVSFQDDFAGSVRELYGTPDYIVRTLLNQGVHPKIGSRVLLYEKDVDADNKEYYICSIGNIVEATADALREYESYGHTVRHRDLTYLQNTPILVKIDRSNARYFSLPLNALR